MQRTGLALQELRIILAHPSPVGTPLLSVQPLLSKCSCDMEWPSVGLEILMMTVRWYVLNKAVSAAQPGNPCGILTGSSAMLENHPKAESTMLDRHRITDILHLD